MSDAAVAPMFVESFIGFGISGMCNNLRVSLAPQLRSLRVAKFRWRDGDDSHLIHRYLEFGPVKAELVKTDASIRRIGGSAFVNFVLFKIMISLLPFRWKWPSFKRTDIFVLTVGPMVLQFGRQRPVYIGRH
jgi:hypothetical protein